MVGFLGLKVIEKFS
jgi:chromosome segregation ATPase